eukprot:gene13226-15629_t
MTADYELVMKFFNETRDALRTVHALDVKGARLGGAWVLHRPNDTVPDATLLPPNATTGHNSLHGTE